ncbi:MAG: hypothetical protein WCI60_04910 [bacterium]
MKLFTAKEYENSNYKSLLLCKCDQCLVEFKRSRKEIKQNLKRKIVHDLCSRGCVGVFKQNKIPLICPVCSKSFSKPPQQYRKTKTHFCSNSCSARYWNVHRVNKGCTRSKLELWLEAKLPISYPSIEILFNDRKTINAELDIYIPSLNLAFEINGAYHYKPIFGEEKLKRTQTTDLKKYQSCLVHNIDLCVIDTSAQKYFSEKSCLRYFDIIQQIISAKMADPVGFEPTQPS